MNQFVQNTDPIHNCRGESSLEDLRFLENVIVVNCGGTINMAGTEERKPSGAVKSQIDAFRQEMQNFNIGIQFIDVFDRPPDSSNVGEDEWEIMYQKMAEIVEEKRQIAGRLEQAGHRKLAKGGIVVTHGTDTLQISSFVISLKFALHDLPVPIIFTGSYAPITHPAGSDGASNLRNALFVAKERLSGNNNLPPGVYVLIGEDIHLASRLAKVYSRPNSEGKYFISFPSPVGKVFLNKKEFRIRVNRQYLERIRGVEPLANMQEIEGWGVVEHLVIDYFAVPQVLADFRERVRLYQATGRRIGLIIQGDFSRNPAFEQFYQLLQELSRMKVITMVGSKKVYDIIGKRGKIEHVGKVHKSLTHARARVKLSWLLKFNLCEAQILHLMDTNIVGDIFEINELPQWIKYETLPDIIKGTEIVMIYPNIHHRVVEDAVRRIEGLDEKRRLTLVGFGDGHIPAPNRSIAQVTEDFVLSEGLLPTASFKGCENVAGVHKELSGYLRQMEQGRLKDYLLRHYVVREDWLRSALYQEMAKERNARERRLLLKQLEETMGRYVDSTGAQVAMKNMDSLLDMVDEHVRFTYAEDIFGREIAQLIAQGQTLLEIVIERHPELIAWRLMKDALGTSHNLLAGIGRAIDNGIMVEIKTSVARAKTNTDLYEIGNMLKIIGVQSDEVAGWKTTYLVRR